jgi:hypothetical protein
MAREAKIVPAIRWWPLLEKICNRPRIQPLNGGGNASICGWVPDERPESGGWEGANWTGAMQMMRDGWQEGAAQIDAIMAQMPEAEALADAWSLEAAGRFPCVPAFTAGDPECMWQTVESDSSKPRVCLVVSACYNCGIGADSVLRYGAAIGATVRALEAAGHGVAVYTIDKRSYEVQQAVIVRDFGEPLDTSIVAYAFHPAFLRRTLFANSELTKEFCDAGVARHGYGYACEVTLADAVASLGEFPATPVVLSGVETVSRMGLTREGNTKALLAHFGKEVTAALAAYGN